MKTVSTFVWLLKLGCIKRIFFLFYPCIVFSLCWYSCKCFLLVTHVDMNYCSLRNISKEWHHIFSERTRYVRKVMRMFEENSKSMLSLSKYDPVSLLVAMPEIVNYGGFQCVCVTWWTFICVFINLGTRRNNTGTNRDCREDVAVTPIKYVVSFLGRNSTVFYQKGNTKLKRALRFTCDPKLTDPGTLRKKFIIITLWTHRLVKKPLVY